MLSTINNVAAMSNLTIETLLNLENVGFDSVVQALPEIRSSHTSLSSVKHLIDAAPDHGIRVLETDRYVFVGGLSNDHFGQNPLEDSDCMGKIVHYGTRRGNATQQAEFYEALGYNSYGDKDLNNEAVNQELATYVTTWLRQQKPMMRSFSAYLRAAGKASGWDQVLLFVRECIIDDGWEYAMDTIAERLFHTAYWNRLDAEIREKFDDLNLLPWSEHATDAWERCVEKGTLGNPNALKLDIYEHSGISYSLSGEGYMCQWDTSRCAALWIPDVHLLADLKGATWSELKGVHIAYEQNDNDHFVALRNHDGVLLGTHKTWAGAVAQLEAENPDVSTSEAFKENLMSRIRNAGRSIVETYTQWANGEVYCMHVHVVDKLSDEEVADHTQIVGGYYGLSEAEEQAESNLLRTVASTLNLH